MNVSFNKSNLSTAKDYSVALERILPQIEASAETAEQATHLSDDMVAEMRQAGFYSLLLPAELGGAELSHIDAMRVVERISHAHGSTGWCIALSNTLGTLMALYVADNGVAQVFKDSPDVIVAGTGGPRNCFARPVDGGYMIKGEWSYASGIRHADWIHSGCFLTDGVNVVKLPNGQPQVIVFHHPFSTVDVKGTWDVLGLRSTGSYDYALKNNEEVFVPDTLCYPIDTKTALRGGLQGTIGVVGYTAWAHTAVVLGIARRALDELAKMARTKVDLFGPTMESATFKYRYASAEAQYRAARALAYESWQSIADSFSVGQPASMEQITMIKLAVRHTHDVASEISTFCHRAARSSSLQRGVLQRCYRDIHATTQHVLIADEVMQECGRVLLGGVSPDATWNVFKVDG